MYRYIFNPSSKKFICPRCDRKRFVPYYDTIEKIIMTDYGKCDRENGCQFFKHPAQDGFSNKGNFEPLKIIKLKTTYHDQNILNETLVNKSELHHYLMKIFGEEKSNNIFKKYKIGTLESNHNMTIFWQIDDQNRIRGGKAIKYTTEGKRTQYFTWMHSILKKKMIIKEFYLEQCLFGLHLTKEDENSVIALVESEKTACIMSVIFPKFLWLACGSKGEFKMSKILPIKGRKIIAFPDCEIQKNNRTTYEEWLEKAIEFNLKGFDIQVSDILEKRATIEQKKEGIDIADIFMK